MKSVFRNTLLTLAVCLVSWTCPAWSFTIPAQEVQPADGVFRFPVSDFADGKAKHFVYKDASDQAIRFLL